MTSQEIIEQRVFMRAFLKMNMEEMIENYLAFKSDPVRETPLTPEDEEDLELFQDYYNRDNLTFKFDIAVGIQQQGEGMVWGTKDKKRINDGNRD